MTKKLSTTMLLACLTVASWLPLNGQDNAPSNLTSLLVSKGILTSEEVSNLESTDPAMETALVALLVDKGILSSAEANNLSPAPVAAYAHAEPQAQASSPVVKAKEKAVKSLTISGRIQGQWDALSTDYSNAEDPRSENNLFLRRIYLGASASFADNLKGTFNANFANGSEGTGELEKAVIDYGFTDNHTLTVGFMKVPFGYNETTSSSKIVAVERSVANRYFVEDLDYGARHTGVFLSGNYDSGVYFTLAATNPNVNEVSSSSVTDKIALWGRFGWSGDLGGGTLDSGVAVGNIPGVRSLGLEDQVWNLYANFKSGPWNILAEAFGGNLEKARYDGSDANPIAYSITPSFKINKKVELVLRYALVDTDGGIGADISTNFRRAPENGGARYDDVEAYYLGGNWYIRGNTLKLSAGYEWAKFEDNLTGTQGDADSEGFRTRMQLLF